MGKGKRNKSRINDNNSKNVKKLTNKEKFLNIIKEYKFIIILAVIFSVYVTFFPKDYTSEIITTNAEIEKLTNKIDELEKSIPADVQAIYKEIEDLTTKRDELKEELNN